MKIIFAITFVAFLGACTAEHRAAIGYAEENAKAFNDTEAKILMNAPCAIRVGAYWRALNSEQRIAVDKLCGK